jgi:hypothetical protein
VLKLVKPRHFLPVHGEAAFLYAHAELAQDLGCRNTSVIRNGEMLGVSDIRSKQHVSMGTAAVRPAHQFTFLCMLELYCAGCVFIRIGTVCFRGLYFNMCDDASPRPAGCWLL